jgi:hypothetical protein
MDSWRKDRLPELIRELVTRPGHEKVRVLLCELLTDGLLVPSHEIRLEETLPAVQGRADALFGGTVFEIKRNLQHEWGDVERRLPDYLADRERQTGRRFLGIATDGASFRALELRRGKLVEIGSFKPDPARPAELLVWLEPAVSSRDDLIPDVFTVTRELGRESLAYARALGLLESMWSEVRNEPEIVVKRKLWDDHLRQVYGSPVGDDRLFLQHTYLTLVAKTMAARVLDVSPTDADGLLTGKPLAEMGIAGAVESDFFDWVLKAQGGRDLVLRVARQVARFRLHAIEHDVLKGLYESLIDPEQRHDLGEYYTPDWLAARVCKAAIADPLDMKVLDPACGSGTFLFHAIRLHLDVAEKARRSNAETLARCSELIRGVDVHPVAVIVARVTYLLALGEKRLRDRAAALSVPVFLGDALQWNTREFGPSRDVMVRVPDEKPLHFPAGLAEEQTAFDHAVSQMVAMGREGFGSEEYRAWIKRELKVSDGEARMMAETFAQLRSLIDAGRDDIWSFVVRNLARPLWLSHPEQRSDVVVGNPPWLSYRYMASEMREVFRSRCKDRHLWVGGKLATQQDLSPYFFARSVELYLKAAGAIAFVMPYAALNRPAYAGLRKGEYAAANALITAAWTFDENVQPLFKVPSCVIFARRETAGPLPKNVIAFSGDLPRRDASEAEAESVLTARVVPWPEGPSLEAGSPYRKSFRQGATIVPRRFAVVEPVDAGRFGGNPTAPRVRGRVTSLDKRPWSAVDPLQGPVESEFLRPLYLGESILPYRLREPALAVIPWSKKGSQEPALAVIPRSKKGGHLLSADGARREGFPHLARWLGEAERLWSKHSRKKADGKTPLRTLLHRWNYQHGLDNQFPIRPLRIIFAASGTNPCAVVLKDSNAVVEHALYWASARSEREAQYLVAIFNSEEARGRVAAMQARGQWGARHFDKLMFELPIPRFDRKEALHTELAEAGEEAAKVAASVPLSESEHFTRARKRIRGALAEAGIAERIDGLVRRLLDKS